MEKMTGKASAPLSMPIPRSPWHSPVPYLFGGLAAMLGLIAFALLILACSYWKLSSRLENSETEDRDLEAGGSDDGDLKPAAAPVFEEKILVIMAGHEKPTYLATPMSSRASSFGSNTSTCTSTSNAQTIHNKSSDDDDDHDDTSTSTSTSATASGVVDQVQRTSDMEDNHETTIQAP